MLHEWQPVLKWLTIVGLVPYAGRNRKRDFQYMQRIYTLVLLAVNWILTAFGIYSQSLEDGAVVSNFISIMVFLTQTVTFTVCLLEVMCTYRQYFAFMQQSKHIVWLFQQRLQTGLCRWSLRRRQYLKYLCYSCAVYGSIILSIVLISIKDYYGYFWYACGSSLVLRIRCFLVIVYMDYIDFYMRHVNMKLRSVVNCRVPRERRLCLDVNYKMLESFDYMLQLKLVYGEIRKLSLMIDDLFGWSICAIFTAIFLDLTVNIYWTFLILSNVVEFYFIYITIITALPLMTIIAYMCHCGENCKQQSITTSILVQRLLHSKHKCTNTKIYNDLLMEFAMEIQQGPMVIAVKEFLTLDLRLLMKIFTSIATYLVILLQFRWIYPGEYGNE
ncbi:putative gustatory receptor 39b [Anastrepha ludens]|uniref:putative gustatory receptor 39b n=1 Tax=Anastrepha ludens TaxID=28586 RepID=UPI0023B0D779|nr:putative gustatory receptor 39b [Anastrepha ludens]